MPHLKKRVTFKQKIRLRKQLNADALFSNMRQEFEKIPDFRKGKPDISIPDALMSSFAMFSLKDPSLLQFDQRRENPAESQNLRNIYGIDVIPSDSRMRELNDEIDPGKYIAPLFKDVFRHLQRGKALEPMVFYEGCYLLNLTEPAFFPPKN